MATSPVSEILDNYRDHEPIGTFLNSISLYLLVGVVLSLPPAIERKVAAKTNSTEFCHKPSPLRGGAI